LNVGAVVGMVVRVLAAPANMAEVVEELINSLLRLVAKAALGL
jgi:hypothetical protein